MLSQKKVVVKCLFIHMAADLHFPSTLGLVEQMMKKIFSYNKAKRWVVDTAKQKANWWEVQKGPVYTSIRGGATFLANPPANHQRLWWRVVLGVSDISQLQIPLYWYYFSIGAGTRGLGIRSTRDAKNQWNFLHAFGKEGNRGQGARHDGERWYHRP